MKGIIMKGKWKLGEPFGIGVFLHWTFAITVFLFLTGGGNPFGFAGGVLFISAVFGCVILHELGHSLAARHYGIGTRDITIYAIGGVASLNRMPKDPKQELVVALAGPAVNVVIAAILFPLLYVVQFANTELATFLLYLGGTNVVLVLFNMLPAFPMDGGRVFRALVSMKKDRVYATNLAAKIGKVIAVLLACYGIFGGGGPMLAFIGMFVWFAGESERQMVEAQESPAQSGVRFGRFGPIFYEFRHTPTASASRPTPPPPPPVSGASKPREIEWEVLPPEPRPRYFSS
ncbi:MAG: site-2 protease family protein [Verrucomicrobiae bacterium]|nr:site-2 protease family protein [Verrucomicrobiae bacterium]